jgi:hypothetical protein
MSRNLSLRDQYTAKRRDDGHFAELERCRCETASERGKVIPVAMLDFLDDAVFAQTANDAGSLSGGLVWKESLQVGVAETADGEFTANDGAEHVEVIAQEEVETAVGTIVDAGRAGDLVQVFDAVGWVVDCGEELEVAAVSVAKDMGEFRKAVDAFLKRRELVGLRPVAVYYLAVVFEKGDVVGCRLDTQHNAMLIVHLNGGGAHKVFDASALNAGMKIVAEFVLESLGEFASEEGRNMVGFDGMNGCADKFFVDGLKVLLAAEDDIGGIFDLHDGPVVTLGKMAEDGTIRLDGLIEPVVQVIDTYRIGEFLGGLGVINGGEGVVQQRVSNAILVELARKFLMRVVVKLQAEWSPRGNAQIAESQVGQDEVKIVMQALARDGFKVYQV